MNVSIEKLEFPCEIKTKILRMINAKINVEFIAGNNVIFDKTNLALMDPHKIIFSNDINSLVVLIYQDSENFYLQDLQKPITFNKLISIVKLMRTNRNEKDAKLPIKALEKNKLSS